MTDTPRTQAELLSIFADQQDHGITAQDMRDFVVSITSPVVDGEFNHYAPDNFYYYQRSNVAGVATLPASGALASGAFQVLSLNPADGDTTSYSVDRPGWHDPTFSLTGSEPEGTFGFPIAAGDVVSLPHGMYVARWFFSLKAADYLTSADDHAVAGQLEQATYEPSPALPPTDPPYIRSYFYNPMAGGKTRVVVQSDGIARFYDGDAILVVDDSMPAPFVLSANTSNHTSDLHLASYGLSIVKLA